jgi:hypothetical protein
MSDDDPDSLTKDPATNVRLGVGFSRRTFRTWLWSGRMP